MSQNENSPIDDNKLGGVGISPWNLLQASMQAVPALKYALGALGLVAVIAIVRILQVDYRVAVFGTITMVVLMVLILVFAALAKTGGKPVRYGALFLLWSFLPLSVLTAMFLFTSAFFDFPKPISQLFGSAAEAQDSATLAIPGPGELRMSCAEVCSLIASAERVDDIRRKLDRRRMVVTGMTVRSQFNGNTLEVRPENWRNSSVRQFFERGGLLNKGRGFYATFKEPIDVDLLPVSLRDGCESLVVVDVYGWVSIDGVGSVQMSNCRVTSGKPFNLVKECGAYK